MKIPPNFLKTGLLFIFSISLFFSNLTGIFAKELKIPQKIKIISREEWGADENIIFEKTNGASNGGEDSNEKSALTEEDMEIERIVTHDENKKQYIWPLQYAKEIKFIVMHHTGLPNELPDSPRAEIQNIFRSHTISRGWGDIGYHYLIDRKGNIYEGRKGGDKVIGGHAKPVNKVSVGVSLMGNYDEEELPAPMLASTIALLDYLSKKYKIDPLGQTEYKEKIYPNIHGHSDNSAKRDPGKFFNQKFQFIRELVAYYRTKKKKSKYFAEIDVRELIAGQPDEKIKFTIRLKNKSDVEWNKNTYLENKSEPALPRIFAKMESNQVAPGALGVFNAEIPAYKISGMAMPRISLVINGAVRPKRSFPLPIFAETYEKPLRVALGFNKNNAKIKSENGLNLYREKSLVRKFGPDETATVALLKSGKYRIKTANGQKFTFKKPPRFAAPNNGIITIENFENRPLWNQNLNDNMFRGVLEINQSDGKLIAINELHLEDYLKGIAEISNSDPIEKIKTIIILSRSYAKYYRDIARKFPGESYDLDDNPDHTQKYIGYGLELRAPNITSAVEETRGKIITYKGKPVITPYFNQSDGRTRSAEEVWGWTDTPYLQSVEDNFCQSRELKGHGVGLSGCGAAFLAKQGKTAAEIIKYYYKGVEITD